MTETIYALASARGRGGVAVIRVSGPHAHDSLKSLTGLTTITPRMASLRCLQNHVSRETLDHALVIPFVAPHSYTGEDVAEYHVHGGVAVVQSVLAALSTYPNHRMAEAGEFTRRAFLNGKMDLTEAEAVADLINAETQLQKAQAMAQMGGTLSRLYEGWREDLTRILAYAEADLEFPDEDLPDGIMPQLQPKIQNLIAALDAHLNDNRRGERLRDGIRVAVIGAPNAGKSSLVNALAQRDVAIVSDIAGTTRDVIEVHLDIGGYPVILSDTAGLRPDQIGTEGHDAIESEGIRRALACAREADLKILLYDATTETPDPHTYALEGQGDDVLIVANKSDQPIRLVHPKPDRIVYISAKNNKGLDQFLESLARRIESLIGVSEAPALTRQRHRDNLMACHDALVRSLSAPLPELTAEDLRIAIRYLGKITGKVDIEDLLDVVFRDFCIGK